MSLTNSKGTCRKHMREGVGPCPYCKWEEGNQSTPATTPTAPSERGAGLKFDSGKPRWSLLMKGCWRALLGVVKVLTFGAKKYSADSWRQVENGEERYRDALYRHLNAIESGEVIDPESGESHWSHVATNALFLEELRVAGKPE